MGDVIEFPTRETAAAPRRRAVKMIQSCGEYCALARLYDPAFVCDCERNPEPPAA